MKIYIVDDDVSFGVELEMKIKQIGYELCGISNSFEHACIAIPNVKPDIILCDIRLDKNKSGVDLAKHLQSLHIPMVFITAYSDESTYNEIKEFCSSFKYLVKPFDKLSLKSILDDLHAETIQLYSNNYLRGEYLYIKKNHLFERITLSDILYLNSEGNYTTLILPQSKFIIKYSLSKLLKIDKFYLFLRIHRNYAVNKHKIKSVNFSNRILSIGTKELPFGRTYTKNIRSLMDMPFSGS